MTHQSLAEIFARITIAAANVLLNFRFETGKVSTLKTINFCLR